MQKNDGKKVENAINIDRHTYQIMIWIVGNSLTNVSRCIQLCSAFHLIWLLILSARAQRKQGKNVESLLFSFFSSKASVKRKTARHHKSASSTYHYHMQWCCFWYFVILFYVLRIDFFFFQTTQLDTFWLIEIAARSAISCRTDFHYLAEIHNRFKTKWVHSRIGCSAVELRKWIYYEMRWSWSAREGDNCHCYPLLRGKRNISIYKVFYKLCENSDQMQTEADA